MPLTVADIDRWNAQAVREVFHAASARAEVTFEASRQLAALSIFANSGGKTAEAAAHHNAGIRRDLDAHGNEALAVARAADRAADGIVKVQSELAALRHAAAAAELTIDALINRVVPIPGLRSTEAQWARTLAKQTELQAELDAIMAEANAVDEELASAVNMADGDAPIPADSGPPVGPEGLTPTQLASDANEERLREERARLQAHLERLQAEYDQLSVRAARDYHNGILDGDAVGRLAALTDELSAARGRLGELDAVDEALSRAPETYLTQLQIPEDPNQQVLAAVAVGNPDTAANVSVTVPGVGSTTRGALPGMVTEARDLRSEVIRQLNAAGKPASVATIAWMGYHPPPNPLDTGSAGDLWQTMTDGQAHAGAADLSRYLQQVRANNPQWPPDRVGALVWVADGVAGVAGPRCPERPSGQRRRVLRLTRLGAVQPGAARARSRARLCHAGPPRPHHQSGGAVGAAARMGPGPLSDPRVHGAVVTGGF